MTKQTGQLNQEQDIAIYLSPQKRLVVAVALLISVFGCNFSFRAFSIALPHIIADWDAMELYTLGATLMTVAMTVATVVVARITPKIGLKQTIMAGLGIIVACNMATLFAPNMLVFVLLRIMTGIGNGIVCGQIAATMNKIWEKGKRGTWIGILGIFQSFTSVVGPTVSGFLVDSFGWQSTYFVISAFQVVGFFMFLFMCPKDTKDRFYKPVKFDLLGTVSFTVFVIALVIVCSYGNSLGWGSPKVILGFVAATAAAIILGFAENKAEERALLPWKLFKKDRNFVKIFLIAIFISLPGMAQVYFMPLYLQSVAETSAAVSGMPFTILSIGSLIASPIAGKIYKKTGKNKLLMAGSGILMSATTLVYGIWIHPQVGSSGMPIIYLLSFIYGLGYILTMTLPYNACSEYLGTEDVGVGTANVYMGITLGSSIGLAVLQALYNKVSASSGIGTGIKAAFICSAVSGALTIILTLSLKKKKG